MAYDYFVEDEYFDRSLALAKQKKRKRQENYIVPLKTFWRPVEMKEWNEYDLTDETYFKKLNVMDNVNKNNYGQFLAKPLRASIQADLQRSRTTLINDLQEGTGVTNLREPTEPMKKENVTFNRYASFAQLRQNIDLKKQKTIIDHKTSKKPYESDIPF